MDAKKPADASTKKKDKKSEKKTGTKKKTVNA
jgi:hypothetical protein